MNSREISDKLGESGRIEEVRRSNEEKRRSREIDRN